MSFPIAATNETTSPATAGCVTSKLTAASPPAAPPTSPWGKVTVPKATCSLEEVMSEQLAEHLNLKELETVEPTLAETANTTSDDRGGGGGGGGSGGVEGNETKTVDSDYLLAQLLQLEYDKEFDEMLKANERVRNRESRVQISYDKFKSVHPVNLRDEQEMNAQNHVDLESESESEDEILNLTFKNGVHGKGENMISKHDIELNNRHNTQRVMKFPPEFETGDAHSIDMRIPNKVYNQLKLHSMAEERRANRLHDKQERSTQEMSLDPKTRLILFKLVNADILESLGGVISTGKEATIFYAPGGKSKEVLVPGECVAKVFKTTLNEFKTREKYIGEDYRFKDRYKHLNPQKIVKLWAEKEMHNLMKMRRFDIPCPDVVLLKKHVLVMSFIGEESVPAPKLKEAVLDDTHLRSAYEQCVQLVKDLYTRCNLVHADFNQFNLLWHRERVWVIDVSQSVEPTHPLGLEFLLRDCCNITKFFQSRGLDRVLTGEQIFNETTGMSFKGEGDVFLSQIQRYVKEKRAEITAHVDNEKNPYNFDFHFERSQRERQRLETTDANDDQDEADDEEDDEDKSDKLNKNKNNNHIAKNDK